MVLRKKEVYTNITPIPSHIPRQLAIDILHSHSEIITLNPLVIDHKPTKAPRDAEADEYYATWYEIVERVQFIPGLGKMGTGQITFKGCFHDMPWGLQTHILAPMNVDLRNNWRIAGNQPGEPPPIRELGIGAPAEGLYLREDIEIRCNITLVAFVKAQLKAASKVLVDRLVKKAELVDAGALLAMMEDGKLRTINPADRSDLAKVAAASAALSSSPALVRYELPSSHPSYQPYGYEPQNRGAAPPPPMELPGDYPPPPFASASVNRASIDPSQRSPPPHRSSLARSDYSSPDPGSGSAWPDAAQSQTSSRPTSAYSSDTGGIRSPGLPAEKAFAAELPAVGEAGEEEARLAAKRREARGSGGSGYHYGPEDFVRSQ